MNHMNKKRKRLIQLNPKWMRILHSTTALSLFAAAPLSLVSCGRNIVAGYAPKNEQEKAELDMESGKFSAAAERLNALLLEDPTNHSARSLLASAYAAQAGITALGLIKSAGSSSASGNSAQRFNAILPDATTQNLEWMDKACDNMAQIPLEARTTEIKLQYSLFFSAYAFLQVKYFTTQAEALASLSAEDATKLIQTLAQAAEAGGSSPLTKAASTFSTSISSASGDGITKVKTVLAASTP
ncbi:MAG: hypothetical protein FJY29_01815 [Betaproteobacteria bacterium]|nr:hypothetical protein [Betaproteobacteria bacterium]